MYFTEEVWNSDYDSTWEDEEPCQKKQKKQHEDNFGNRAARDMQNYRHGYGGPGPDTDYAPEYPEEMPNLLFYQNQIEFEPNGVIIEEIHQYWRNDYRELENNHSYIQWLFPLREHGVNPHATPLTPAEIRMMRADEGVMRRLLKSYKLMLGFYGIHLLDEKTGEVSTAKNWEERYHNLNRRSHNNLRITRILKCLGEMGYDHLQAPLVQFFLEETLCNHQLPNVKRSVLDYFMFTVKDKEQRRKLVQFAWENYKSQKPFIWGPVAKLRNLTPKKEKKYEGTKEEMEDGENPEAPSNDPHEKTRTGEDMGDHGRSGADRTQDHGASEQRDGVSSSENEQQTTESNSSGYEQQTTESNSSGTERLITKDSSAGNEQPITEDSGSGNERLITEGNSSGNDQLITEGNSSGKDCLVKQNNSSGTEQLITGGNSPRNDGTITEGKSSEIKQLITEDNRLTNNQITEDSSSENKGLTTEDSSSGSQRLIAVNNSSGNKQLIIQDNSSGNVQMITEGNRAGNEQLITKSKSSGNEWVIIKDNGSGPEDNSSGCEQMIMDDDRWTNKNQITEDSSSGNKGLITEGNSNEKVITEDSSSGTEGLITEGNRLSHEKGITVGNTSPQHEQLITEGNSSENKGLTTEGNSSGSQRLIAVNNSSGTEWLITEESSSGNVQIITEGNRAGNKGLIIEDNRLTHEKVITVGNTSPQHEQLVTENSSSGNELSIPVGNVLRNGQLIIKDNSSGSEQLITVDSSLNERKKKDNSLTHKKLITACKSLTNAGTTEDNSSGYKEEPDENTSLMGHAVRYEKPSTQNTIKGNDQRITEDTNCEIKSTQPKKFETSQAEGTKDEEKLHKQARTRPESTWDYVLSFFGYCCHHCFLSNCCAV